MSSESSELNGSVAKNYRQPSANEFDLEEENTAELQDVDHVEEGTCNPLQVCVSSLEVTPGRDDI